MSVPRAILFLLRKLGHLSLRARDAQDSMKFLVLSRFSEMHLTHIVEHRHAIDASGGACHVTHVRVRTRVRRMRCDEIFIQCDIILDQRRDS